MENPAIYFKGLFSKTIKTNWLSVESPVSPFGIIVRKEIADLVRSWRFIVLLVLIVLTFLASMYVSLANIKPGAGVNDP